MAKEVFELALLLTAKDAATGNINRVKAELRSLGKDSELTGDKLDNLRERMNRGLAISGTGIAGLALFSKGVQVAADFQASMTDLRATLAQVDKDGKVNLESLGKDMLKAEAIATKLGNALPGSTEDFIKMMQVLKQNGLETETILKGAAEAVGNLAVANNALPKDVAKDFAQFGQLFKLKPEEYIKAADTFSRLFTSSGIGSSELIEGLKYFQGRSGNALGIQGLEDAEKTVRVMGLLRKQGLEGSLAGTAFNNLFSGYISAGKKDDNPLERLKKKEGIDLKFFDKKGNFAGIDNLFKQLEPLQKLTEEKRVNYLKEIFGEEGMSAATAILKAGAEGWRQYNVEQDKVISLQEKNAQKAKDFNNQMEALTGSVKNLVVTGFEPLLPKLTQGVEYTNKFVGSVQQFAKANPIFTATTTSLLGVGSAALVAYGGFKFARNGLELYRNVSNLTKNTELIAGLTQSRNAASNLGSTIVSTSEKTKGLRSNLLSLNNVFKAVLVIETAGVALDQIEKLRNVVNQWKDTNIGLDASGQQQQKVYSQLPADLKNTKNEAESAIRLLQQGNKEFEKALDSSRIGWYEFFARTTASIVTGVPARPSMLYSDGKEKATEQNTAEFRQLIEKYRNLEKPSEYDSVVSWAAQDMIASENIRKRVPILKHPDVMSQFRQSSVSTLNLNSEMKQKMERWLQLAFPESFAQSTSLLYQQQQMLTKSTANLAQSFPQVYQQFSNNTTALDLFRQNLNQSTQPFSMVQQNVSDLGSTSKDAVSPVGQLSVSALKASNGLDIFSNKVSSFEMPVPRNQPIVLGNSPTGNIGGIIEVPSRAIGGVVEKDGLAQVHAGNVITPAKVTKGLSGKTSGVTIHAPINVTINGADKNAKEEFRSMLYAHAKDLERIVADCQDMGRIRS